MRRLVAVAVALAGFVLPAAAFGATAPVLLGSTGDSTDMSGLVSVAVSGHYAYSTAYWQGRLVAFDISNPSSPQMVGETPQTTSLENGTNITIVGSDAYVVSKNRNASTVSNDDGSGNSLTIVDISDPTHPTVVTPNGTLHDSTNLFGSYGIAVRGNYAYVANQGILGGQPNTPDTSTGGFSVIDWTTMTVVKHFDNDSLPAPWTGQNVFDHSTSVALSGNYAYVTAFDGDRVTVVDISNPLSPQIVASLANNTHTEDLAAPVDLAVQGNYLYVANQVGTPDDELTVIDISNPLAPTVVGSLADGRLNAAYRIRVSGDFAYLSASTAQTVAAIDISDPAAPRLAGLVDDPVHLNKTTGLDLESTSSGEYVAAVSPYQSGQPNTTTPPYPGTSSPPTDTGTLSVIQLDPNPIQVTIASEPANPTTQTSAAFTFSVNDDVSAVQCQLDGAPLAPCTSATTANYSALSAGSHTFTVQATDASGNTSTQSYAWTVGTGPASAAPVNSSLPTISGSALQGQTLTASSGTWSGNPAPKFGYQWQQCAQNGQGCTPISNAGSSSYTVQPNDVGHTLAVVVTAINTSGSPTAQSKPTAVVQVLLAPMNSSPPTVSGSAVTGQALTASPGTWSGNPAPTFAYQWKQCGQTGQGCTSISGAVGTSYTVKTGDAGKTLAVVVTGTNGSGVSSAQSQPTAVVPSSSAAPKNTSLPKVSGTAQSGNRLTGSNGTWSGSPSPSFTYKWERCTSKGAACKTISGQTKSTYAVVSGDTGSTLRFLVTGTNASGSATAVSAATAAVGSAMAQTATWRASLIGASTRKPSLRIMIPAQGGNALVTSLTVSLPKGIRFSGTKSTLVKEVTLKDQHGKRMVFTVTTKHGGLVLSLKRPTAGVDLVVSGQALSVSKAFLAASKKPSSPVITVTVAQTPRAKTRGRLKLRLS
jgi:hypothetical protein